MDIERDPRIILLFPEIKLTSRITFHWDEHSYNFIGKIRDLPEQSNDITNPSETRTEIQILDLCGPTLEWAIVSERLQNQKTPTGLTIKPQTYNSVSMVICGASHQYDLMVVVSEILLISSNI